MARQWSCCSVRLTAGKASWSQCRAADTRYESLLAHAALSRVSIPCLSVTGSCTRDRCGRGPVRVDIVGTRYEAGNEGKGLFFCMISCTRARVVCPFGVQVFVHPVVPVLNETRPIVKAFNQQLQSAVVRLGKTTAHLKWLDFSPDLLTADGLQVRPLLLCMSARRLDEQRARSTASASV